MNMNIKGNFTSIPNSIVRDKELPNYLFRTLVALKSYGYGENLAFPSQRRVANDLGVSRETINRHVKKLKDIGYLKTRRRGYSKSNEYIICDRNITYDRKGCEVNNTSSVMDASHQVLQTDHSNKKHNNTNNNDGFEILKGKMVELRLKKDTSKKSVT
jgi:biotin operon repressor